VSRYSGVGNLTPDYYLAKLRISQGRYVDALSAELIDEISNSVMPESEKQAVLVLLRDNLNKIHLHGKRASEIVAELQEHSAKGTAEAFFDREDSTG